jgi:hypothetical protein
MTGTQPDQDALLKEYVLGGLTPAQREEIDERLLVDPDFHDEVRAAGDDVIHAYLSDELPRADRERFESFFLASPRRQERVAFMRSLLAAADAVQAGRAKTGATRRPPHRWRLAAALPWAAALLVGLAGGGWAVGERRLRHSEADAAQANEAALLKELETHKRRAEDLRTGTGDIAIWPLDAGVERGAGTAGSFAPDRPWIRLRVPLDRVPRRARYRASLQDVNGREITAFKDLEATAGPNGPGLDVIVQASLLGPGAYVLSVQDVTGTREELTAAPFEVR